MKRLLINLVLLGFIAWLGYRVIYPMIMCFGSAGQWRTATLTCDMGTFQAPDIRARDVATTTVSSEHIDLSRVTSLTVAIPDLQTNVSLVPSTTTPGLFEASFPIRDSGVVGVIRANITEAVVSTSSQVALVPFAVNAGGSGTFIYAGLFTAEGASLRSHDAHFVGDRVRLTGIRLVDGSVALIEYLDRAVSDAMTATPSVPHELSLPITSDIHFGTEAVKVISTSKYTYKDTVQVTTDLSGPIASPLVLKGAARGTWFFEGSFPVDVVDGEGVVLGTGIATAQGEWMTTEYVPFTAQVSFTRPSSPHHMKGILILRRDNPSGLPENSDAFEIPITLE